MAKKFYQPTRMCISCRKRDNQSNLFRLQCKDGVLSSFNGIGRSFYICHICLEEDKKVLKALMRTCRSGDKEKLMNKLKESIAHERKS
ncbi:MAG: DUF448 domain-containing protein [Epsilonproteobacteria bacterium]|nr:DUF448 domain-containing protein [Campylobacterota bacterium]